MSIVKMKRLRLFGMASDREDLLRELQHLGCVEVIEPEVPQDDPAWAGLTRVSDTELAQRKSELAALQAALSTLDKYGKAKGKLLSARPVITEADLFSDLARQKALAAAEAINEQEKRIAGIYSEKSKLQGQKLALSPWLELDVPLDAPSTHEVAVTFGSLSTRTPLEELPAQLSAAADLCELVYAGRDAEQQYVLVLCHRSQEEAAFEVLKKYGFARSTLRDWHGTARENTEAMDQRLKELDADLTAAQAAIQAQSDRREELKRCVDRTNQDIQREECKGRLLQSQAVIFLEGWVPAERLGDLERVLDQYGCAFQCADPTPEEYPDVPVKLKNNWLTRPLNMVTEMYSLPAYDGVDPNPLMAPFFILFYGIMLADMGYGLLMIIASLVVTKKMKPKGTAGHLFGLMGLCGVSTFVVGALTGGFFGDFIPQLLKLINPNSTFALPSLFTPLDDTLAILVGAMCLGFVQIITGMVISFVNKLRAGEVMDGIFEEVTWWVVFAGAGLAILGVTPLVLILGGVMILAGAVWGAREAKGFGKVLGTFSGIFGSLYNHITGYFGDILSYSRLMALMLAGSVIAQVFNTLGAIPGNIILFLVISFAGNALNFALNLLGCYVHDLRLQCLEYFGKFYKDGGRPFQPLSVNTKYYDVVE